jgi:CHAT domain-containing protein/Flp pilus assembly protein TadD
MTRPLAKSLFVLLALGLWILPCPASLAEDDDPKALNQQVYQLVEQGKYQEAISIAERAVEVAKRARGRQSPETATVLSILGALFENIGEYAKAEPLFEEALRIRQKVLGSKSSIVATSLSNLGVLYTDMGNYTKAEAVLQEALQIDQKGLGPEDPQTVICLNNLATLYVPMGDYGKAESLLQEALQVRRKVLGSENPNTTTSLINLVISLDNLGLLYETLGDYAKAEPLLREALPICQKVRGEENRGTALALINLATVYYSTREYAKAEPLFQEALRIFQKVLGPEHPFTANSLNNLGILYQQLGEYAKAEPLFQEALGIYQKALGSEHTLTANCLTNLGSLYRAMGEYAKAEPLFQEALRIRQKVLGSENLDSTQDAEHLAYCELDLGRIDRATALARQASAAKLKILSKILSFTTEEQRLAYLHIFDPYSLFPFLQGTTIDLAAVVLRYKGVVLDSIIEDRLLAEASPGSEDQKLVAKLNLDKSQLGQLLLEPISEKTNQRIDALEGKAEQIESHLAQHVAGLGKARRALGVRLEQVQQAIPEDGVLIEYLEYSHYLGKYQWEWRYGAIVLFPNGAPLWISLGKTNDIDRLVRRYVKLVRGAADEAELSANLQALYEVLWAPIERALPSQTKRIIISPDGQLNFVSFATLLTEDSKFLAQTFNVQYVASGRDLLREPRPSTAKEVVLFANPDFDLASTAMLAKANNGSSDRASKIRASEKKEMEDWSFESLEGTQKERDELIKKFARWGWMPTDFTAKEATKETLLKIHSPYILHLATHGFFAKEDPTATQSESEALLNDRQSVAKSKFFKNPMHRSGLTLAGAQTTIEAWKRGEAPPVENDGILTAEDVSTLDLQKTWLVTLSACDTGSGEARAGEGVMGLRRGFVEAGAQNLLMTLWPVSDKAIVQIMSDFYEAAHDTGNAPEALAEVQRNWLLKLRTDEGLTEAVNLAGPFIMSSQGKP